MKADAIEKAKDRLASAKARLKDLESSKSYNDARRHWYEFLLSSNSVFSILQQGAKGSSKSTRWFEEKREQRKTDPLLRYVQHARNADEHNIPSVTEVDRPKVVLVENGKPVAAIENMEGNKGVYRPLSADTRNLKNINEMRIYPERAKLIRVRDRGALYEPPTEHFGKAIDDDVSPAVVAQLMMKYIEEMTAEAETLV